MQDGTPCFECGKSAVFHHHVIPKSQGGKHTVPLCADCHGIVHSRTFTTNYRLIIKQAMARAKARGVRFGRTKALTPAQATELRALRAEGVTLAALMQRYGIGKTAVYRYLRHAPRDVASWEAAD